MRAKGAGMALRLACAAILAACFCPPVYAGQRGDVEVRVTRPSDAWVSEFACPVTVEANSSRSGTLRTVMHGDSWRIVRNVNIDAAAGGPARFETPMFSVGGFNLDWSLGGRQGREWVGRSGYYSHDDDIALVCVNAVLLRELGALPERTGDSHRVVRSLSRVELPSDWQSYVGFSAMLLVDAGDLRQITPRQAEAMALWVKWLGGRLWVLGEDGEKALERIGLPLSRASVSNLDGVRRARVQAGVVYLQSDAEPSRPWDLGKAKSAAPLRNHYENSYSRYGPPSVGAFLLRELGGIRTEFIIAALAVLGILLGPVNYIFVKRRKNPLLLYVLTPLCALIGSAAIIGGSFLMEGVGAEYNQFAVLARHAGGNDAMLFDMRGVRPGFVLPELKFGAETLALPFTGEERSEEVTMDLTDGVVLGNGWLRPRFATGYLTARPLVSRMNVEVRGDGAGYKVVNGLGHRLKKVAALLPDGNLGWAESVDAGAETPLAVERGTRRYEELRGRLGDLVGGETAFEDVRLVAETEGLPYLDDGGLGGTLRSGRYFYVVAGDGGGQGEKP